MRIGSFIRKFLTIRSRNPVLRRQQPYILRLEVLEGRYTPSAVSFAAGALEITRTGFLETWAVFRAEHDMDR